jgi:hypothetical protein
MEWSNCELFNTHCSLLVPGSERNICTRRNVKQLSNKAYSGREVSFKSSWCFSVQDPLLQVSYYYIKNVANCNCVTLRQHAEWRWRAGSWLRVSVRSVLVERWPGAERLAERRVQCQVSCIHCQC